MSSGLRSAHEFGMTALAGVTADWAWAGADGSGVRVCVVDSGVDGSHPLIGDLERSVTVAEDPDGEIRVVDHPAIDEAGHGTACAGIIRGIAPGASISSVRVLTNGKSGTGAALLAGLDWAIAEGFDLINLSLATTQSRFVLALHDLADRAYFRRNVIVVSAHNRPVLSYPWTFSSIRRPGSSSSKPSPVGAAAGWSARGSPRVPGSPAGWPPPASRCWSTTSARRRSSPGTPRRPPTTCPTA